MNNYKIEKQDNIDIHITKYEVKDWINLAYCELDYNWIGYWISVDSIKEEYRDATLLEIVWFCIKRTLSGIFPYESNK